MRLLSAIILTMVIATIYAQEAATIDLTALDATSRRDVETALNAAQRARVAYLQAIDASRSRAIQGLERQITAATRRGDLNGALAIKGAVDALNAGWIKNQVEINIDILGNRVVGREELILSNVNGRWSVDSQGKWSATYFIFNSETSTVMSQTNRTGTFSITNTTITITMDDNNVITLISNGNTLEGSDRHGTLLLFRKQN
jgi:hypothetical protein